MQLQRCGWEGGALPIIFFRSLLEVRTHSGKYSPHQVQIDWYTLIEQSDEICTIILMHNNVHVLCIIQVPNIAFYAEYKFEMIM